MMNNNVKDNYMDTRPLHKRLNCSSRKKLRDIAVKHYGVALVYSENNRMLTMVFPWQARPVTMPALNAHARLVAELAQIAASRIVFSHKVCVEKTLLELHAETHQRIVQTAQDTWGALGNFLPSFK